MQKKLTITLDEKVYLGLYATVGERKISKFIENLVKPYVITNALAAAYQEMSRNEADEQDAIDWIEGLIENDND